jgi:hypothetical protein
MPRIQLATLVIVFTANALWLSTFASYAGADDVRAFIMLAIVVASGAEAFYSTDANRAFWSGFFATLVLMTLRSIAGGNGFRWPRLTWIAPLSVGLAGQFPVNPLQIQRLIEYLQASLFLLTWLIVATLIGLICVYIYYRHHEWAKQP